MTYLPTMIPLWCWALAEGADQVFFSQPTHAWMDGTEQLFHDEPACLARCQHETRFVMDEVAETAEPGTGLLPPIQCGQLARLDPRGRYLCWYHWQKYWLCAYCQTFLPRGEDSLAYHQWSVCSQACHDAIEEEDW